MVTNLDDYKTASRLSPHINAGASARLNLQPMVSDLSGEAHAAFCHGWRTTDEAENRAGRTIPGRGFTIHQDAEMQVWKVDPCPACGGGPVYCRHCMTATSMVGG